MVKLEDIHDVDCVIVTVAHNEFRTLKLDRIESIYRRDNTEKVLIDIKGLYNIEALKVCDLKWWRL